MPLSRSPTSRNFSKYSNGMLTRLPSNKNKNTNTNTSYKNAKYIHSSRYSTSLQSNEGRIGKPGKRRKNNNTKKNRGPFYRATASNIKKHKRLMNNQTRVFRTKSGRTLTGLSRQSISSPR